MMSGLLTICSERASCFNWLSGSFTGKGPPYCGWLFRDDGQVRACGRVWLTAALLPLLQRALADAIGSRKISPRHFHPLANSLHVDRLRPDLLQFDFAALVRQDQLHSLDQVRSKGRGNE